MAGSPIPPFSCRIIGHADIIRQWDWTYQLLASGHDGTMASGGSSPAGLVRQATIQHFELAEGASNLASPIL